MIHHRSTSLFLAKECTKKLRAEVTDDKSGYQVRNFLSALVNITTDEKAKLLPNSKQNSKTAIL